MGEVKEKEVFDEQLRIGDEVSIAVGQLDETM